MTNHTVNRQKIDGQEIMTVTMRGRRVPDKRYWEVAVKALRDDERIRMYQPFRELNAVEFMLSRAAQ